MRLIILGAGNRETFLHQSDKREEKVCRRLLRSGRGEGRAKKTANVQKDLLNVQKREETVDKSGTDSWSNVYADSTKAVGFWAPLTEK